MEILFGLLFIIMIIIIIKASKKDKREINNIILPYDTNMSKSEMEDAIVAANKRNNIINMINNSAFSGYELIKNDIIEHPGIALQHDEYCIYKNNASIIKYEKMIKLSTAGILYLTVLRILFESSDKIIEIDRKDIIKVEAYQDGIIFKAKNEKTYIFQTDDIEKIIEVLAKINKVVREDKEIKKENIDAVIHE